MDDNNLNIDWSLHFKRMKKILDSYCPMRWRNENSYWDQLLDMLEEKIEQDANDAESAWDAQQEYLMSEPPSKFYPTTREEYISIKECKNYE